MQNILVPVDFSTATEPVVRSAIALARAFDARLCLLHVAAPDPDFVGYRAGPASVRHSVAAQFHDEHVKLQELKGRWPGAPDRISTLLIQGVTADKIIQEQERLQADCIVLGSHGHGALHHLLTGSVAAGVLKKAACPVLIVPVRPAASTPPVL